MILASPGGAWHYAAFMGHGPVIVGHTRVFLCGVIFSTRVRALLAALWRHSKRKRVITVGSAAKERSALVKQEQ